MELQPTTVFGVQPIPMPHNQPFVNLPQMVSMPQIQPLGTLAQFVDPSAFDDGSQMQFNFFVEEAPTEAIEAEQEEQKEDQAQEPEEEIQEIGSQGVKTRDATVERKQPKGLFSLFQCQ